MSRKITIDRYLNELAAETPTPGGGSAAALVGAVGMSLLSMVAKYALKNAGDSASRAKLSKILKFSERSRRRLTNLMAKDEAAYLRLSKALKRGSAKDLTGLYEGAAAVPLEVCGIVGEGLKRCGGVSVYCRRLLASDLAEAVLLLKTAFLAAKFNVDINLGGIKDKAYKKKARKLLLRGIR